MVRFYISTLTQQWFFVYRKIEIELRRKAEEEIHKNDIFLSKVSFSKKYTRNCVIQ